MKECHISLPREYISTMHFLRCRCGVVVAVQRKDAPSPPDIFHSRSRAQRIRPTLWKPNSMTTITNYTKRTKMFLKM